MYTYLGQHPDIFMPAVKEPHHLSTDLDSGGDEDGRFFIRDRDRYLALFNGATSERVIGDASTLNLYSKAAPAGISSLAADPRIIIQIREPIEQMYSFHNMRSIMGFEDKPFRDALDAESDRREGRRLPGRRRNLQMYQYRSVARFSEQIDRYLERFGPSRVHIVVFDDLQTDPLGTYMATLQFLGVDPSFRPTMEVENSNLRPRNGQLFRLMYSPKAIRAVRRFLPGPVQRSVAAAAHRVIRLNRQSASRPPLDRTLRASLQAEFTDEVRRLSGLVGRDLAHLWYGREEGALATAPASARPEAGRHAPI
ncbi:sulfotransferase [soil metagenome]